MAKTLMKETLYSPSKNRESSFFYFMINISFFHDKDFIEVVPLFIHGWDSYVDTILYSGSNQWFICQK